MAGTKEIKRRIKSIKNTKKITKAMELVAASKMKRAVSSALASRLYAKYSWEILTSIAQNGDKINHSFFMERDIKEEKRKVLLILISSSRGLCGAYNAQIIKRVISLLGDFQKIPLDVDILTIGKKGDLAMRRMGLNVVASFAEISNGFSLSKIVPISDFIINEYKNLNYDKVLIAYTDFISALTQKPHIRQVLPVSKTDLKALIETLGYHHEENKLNKKDKAVDYLFEGEKEELVGSLAEKLTKMQIYQMLLESNASEQSSRMMAMKNASDASSEMIDDLTLVFNKARQANITREISEISAGMTSVN